MVKRVLKRTLWWTLVLLVVGAVGGGIWLRTNLDSLVKRAIVHYGSAITQVPVKVASVEIDSTNGRGKITGLVVGNPRGFKTPYAFKAEDIEVVVDIASITRSVILVKKITVLAPNAIYEQGDKLSNFDVLQKNVAEGLGANQGASPASGPPRKLIVEDFSVRRAKAQGSAAFWEGKTVDIELPDIQLRDIGKAQGGVTPAELGQIISKALSQRMMAAFSWDRVKKSLGNGLDKAGSALKGLFN